MFFPVLHRGNSYKNKGKHGKHECLYEPYEYFKKEKWYRRYEWREKRDNNQ